MQTSWREKRSNQNKSCIHFCPSRSKNKKYIKNKSPKCTRTIDGTGLDHIRSKKKKILWNNIKPSRNFRIIIAQKYTDKNPAEMQSGENDESWSIPSIEEQYMEAIERQPNYETQYLNERDTSVRNIFHNFQESATSIAQLYRGRCFHCHYCSCSYHLFIIIISYIYI